MLFFAHGMERALVARTALVLLALHVGVSLLGVVPGYLSIDEVTYHLMVKNLAEGRGLDIWNGYEEYPSPELLSAALVAHEGRLKAALPYLQPIVSLPFYLLAGYRGLFLVNAIAFVGIVGLTWDLARRLFGSDQLAFGSILILSLSTFLWDYSQAAWPHATATFWVVAAMWCFVRSWHGEGQAPWAMAAGLCAGIGAGFRLDVIFVLPAFLIPYLFHRPPRWQAAGELILGFTPGLIFLFLLSRARFGKWMPLSYGEETTYVMSLYVALLSTCALGGVGVWLVSRQRPWAWVLDHRKAASLVGVGVMVSALLIPLVRQGFAQWLNGAYQLIVDLRIREYGGVEPALDRAPGGGLVYIGALKKSFIQSCPYLPILFLAAEEIVQRGKNAVSLVLVSLPVIPYVLFYSHYGWHGGLSLNLRYFSAILPFVAIITAWAWDRIARACGAWKNTASICGFAGGASLFLVSRLWLGRDLAGEEIAYLDIPQMLAISLAVCLVVPVLLHRTAPFWSCLQRTLLAMGLVWATAVAFTYDWPRERAQRARNLSSAQRAARLMPADALLFTPYVDAFWGLMEHGRVRIANPTKDAYRDFRPLVLYHLGQGRAVYAALEPSTFIRLEEEGKLQGLELQTVWTQPPFELCRIGPAFRGEGFRP